MSGPPPNPNAVRRNKRVGLTRLPAAGRKGRTPKWPLHDNPELVANVSVEQSLVEELEERRDAQGLDGREAGQLTRGRRRLAVAEATLETVRATEAEIWRDVWRTPQAVQWEKLRWTREVAQYVRWKALAEAGSRAASGEARALADHLGLTPKAMRALMWSIEEVASRAIEPATSPGGPARRRAAVDRRLVVVEDDESAGAR